MKKLINTKEEFLNSTLSNYSQLYFGKNNCCRCGCKGEYYSTTFMDKPRSEVNDSYIEKQLTRAKRLVLKGADIEIEGNYINIPTGETKALTFYLDDLKE